MKKAHHWLLDKCVSVADRFHPAQDRGLVSGGGQDQWPVPDCRQPTGIYLPKADWAMNSGSLEKIVKIIGRCMDTALVPSSVIWASGFDVEWRSFLGKEKEDCWSLKGHVPGDQPKWFSVRRFSVNQLPVFDDSFLATMIFCHRYWTINQS